MGLLLGVVLGLLEGRAAGGNFLTRNESPAAEISRGHLFPTGVCARPFFSGSYPNFVTPPGSSRPCSGMRNLRRLSCLGATILTSIGILAGCSGGLNDDLGTGATSGDDGAGGSGIPGAGGNGAGNGPGAGGNGSGADGSGGTIDPTVCVPGVPATSQIPRLLNRQYDRAVMELVNVSSVGDDRPSELLIPDATGSLDAYTWTAYLNTADAIAKAVMADPAKKAKFISCDASEAACLETTIKTFGRKAFRRPLREDEVAEFMKFNSLTPPPASADEVAEAILYGFLVSPSFLLLPELDVSAQENGATKLNHHEVAVRLASALWGSIPDDELAKAADDGLLGTKEQILQQAQRMVLDKDQTGPLVSAFHRSYFDMDHERWRSQRHDPELYPEYTEETRAASHAEVEALVADIAFNGGKFSDIFLSNVGFVNKHTATIYGLNPADFTDELKRVELDPEQRPGVLSRIGFLASHAGSARTSPILRGAFVTSQMMGISFGPPTPGAELTPDPTGTFTTMRELTEAKTGSGPCADCHGTYVNPPGFVLERYDAIGAWQVKDLLGGDINGSAMVTIDQALNQKEITAPRQLMEEIGLGQRAQWQYIQKWISFVYGRLANENDNCAVLDLGMKMAEDYTILDLLTDLTQTDSFRARKTSL